MICLNTAAKQTLQTAEACGRPESRVHKASDNGDVVSNVLCSRTEQQIHQADPKMMQ